MNRRDITKEFRALSARVGRIERALGKELDERIAELDAEDAVASALADHDMLCETQRGRCERAAEAVKATKVEADGAAKAADEAGKAHAKLKDADDGKKAAAAALEGASRKAEECAYSADQAVGHHKAMEERMKTLEKSKPKLDDFLPKPEKSGKKVAEKQ